MMTAPANAMTAPAWPVEPAVLTGEGGDDHPFRDAVLLLGNFDGFHIGHRALLGIAQRIAGGRPVGVMSCEPHPRSFFRSEPESFRLATAVCKPRLLAAHGIDFIFSPRFDSRFAGQSPVDFVTEVLVGRLGVAHVVAGSDFRFGSRRGGDMALLESLGRVHGLGVSTAPEVTVRARRASSTAIREFIRAGQVSAATELLGSGWLVETRRSGDGRQYLHADLCRPLPGRYLGRPDEAPAGAAPMPIEIGEDGSFSPLAPCLVGTTLWRLLSEADPAP